MKYYIYENGSVAAQEVDVLPQAVEEIYAYVRQKYIIEYDYTDWADDDTDSGWGYDYDNSFSILYEPKRRELVIRDGALYGFRVHENKILVPGETTLAMEGSIRKRYGDQRSWTLIEEEHPAPADHVFLPRVESPDKDYEFSPADFPAGLVEDVVEKINVQDTRGHFDGRVRLTLKLTPEAVADPDGTLAAFAGFYPTLVKVR